MQALVSLFFKHCLFHSVLRFNSYFPLRHKLNFIGRGVSHTHLLYSQFAIIKILFGRLNIWLFINSFQTVKSPKKKWWKSRNDDCIQHDARSQFGEHNQKHKIKSKKHVKGKNKIKNRTQWCERKQSFESTANFFFSFQNEIFKTKRGEATTKC
jgi:hypothetical protein